MSENTTDSKLAAFRKQIDEMDDKIIQLLIERIGIVSQVGEMKRKVAPGACPIRAGREAEQVRRIMKKFENLGRSDMLLPAAAAALWRIIIGMSTSIESPLKLSAFASDDNDLYWLAREYFGPFAPVIRQPQAKRVIGDIMDGKASVGIMPLPDNNDSTNWWISLMDQSPEIPKIFARVPFVNMDAAGKDVPSGLAIARVMPEASGDDVSLWAMEADHHVSQHRLQTAFASAKLETSWLNIATMSPITRHHLVEIKGFIPSSHEGMQSTLAGLDKAIVNVGFIGAYAVPVTLNQPETRPVHAKAVATT
jgi:chorismate mutase